MNSNIYNRIKEVVLYFLGLVNIFSTALNDLLTNKTTVILHHSALLSSKIKKTPAQNNFSFACNDDQAFKKKKLY